MPLYIAFLRGINVGGHTVKMDRLRAIFEELKLERVETFIASGNVIFHSRARNRRSLEALIEEKLESSLGFGAATFVRTVNEVDSIARFQAFPQDRIETAHALIVGFLRSPASAEVTAHFAELESPVDSFCVRGSEYYWLVQVPMQESLAAKTALAKSATLEMTTRNITTLRKLAAKYPPSLT